MDNVPPMQVEARLAQIRRQKANLEQLVELEREEQLLMALQGGVGVGHLPTPANLMQTTEVPTPTTARATSAVDLTSPPPPRQQVKREPKDEKEKYPFPGPAAFEGARDPRNATLEQPDQLPHRPRASQKRQRGDVGNGVFDSVPPGDIPQQQGAVDSEELFNGRKSKKQKQVDTRFFPVVNDVEYRTIIKDPNGDGRALVEVACKFCGANCAAHSGVKLFFRGDSSWRGHVNNCHRRSLPAGTRLTASYLMANCLTIRKLDPKEVEAVLHHKHAEFTVVMKPGPGAEPGSISTHRRRKRGTAAAKISGEAEAEREILEAIEAPLRHAIASIDAMVDDELFTDEEEFEDAEDVAGTRPFGMSTRQGGRRTRDTPDFVIGKVE